MMICSLGVHVSSVQQAVVFAGIVANILLVLLHPRHLSFCHENGAFLLLTTIRHFIIIHVAAVVVMMKTKHSSSSGLPSSESVRGLKPAAALAATGGWSTSVPAEPRRHDGNDRILRVASPGS